MLILKEFILFILPITLANIIHHWIIIPHNFLKFLSYPIDGNITINGAPLFGKNKTYRGLFIVTIFTGIFFVLFNNLLKLPLIYSNFLSGSIYGLFYILSELPNSFIKRRLHLSPGKNNLMLFYLVDELDSVIGAIIALSLIYYLKPYLVVLLLFTGGILHYTINILLYHFGYKKKLPV